ncbi:hypothetical protein Tco_0575899 [Tanacetum coccineum]
MGSPMTQPLQELKTGDVKVTLKLPSHCDPTEVEVESTFFNIYSIDVRSFLLTLLLKHTNCLLTQEDIDDSPKWNDLTVSGLVIHMFVDKKYPLTINLIERMLDHQLEICHGTVGNELTTAVQLIAFLKKQIFYFQAS